MIAFLKNLRCYNYKDGQGEHTRPLRFEFQTFLPTLTTRLKVHLKFRFSFVLVAPPRARPCMPIFGSFLNRSYIRLEARSRSLTEAPSSISISIFVQRIGLRGGAQTSGKQHAAWQYLLYNLYVPWYLEERTRG
jgi:hypothetical protein